MQAVEAFDKLFIALVAVLVAAVLAGRRGSNKSPPPPGLRALQWQYMAVWLSFKAADWMQGPYFHDLYSSKVFDGVPITDSAVANLFLCGFLSAMLFGAVAGGLVDRYGRRLACVAFVLLQTLASLSTVANDYTILALGRVCGGFATSLLMSAPEAWLCAEHGRRRLPSASLGDLFGAAYFADALVAIGAGQLADAAAAAAGPAAPFVASIAFLLIGAVIALAAWPENYGAATADGGSQGMGEALKVLARDPAVLSLGLLQALFEGAMYIFVLVWGGAMASAVAAADAGATPFGKIFSCFMACCMLGGSLFSLMGALHVRAELYMQPVLLAAALALLAAATAPPAALSHWVWLTGCFCVFEASVGVYFPAVGGMRSTYLPDAQRGALINLSRVPLNLLVIAVALFRERLGTDGALQCAAAALAVAAVLARSLSQRAAAKRD